MKKLKTFVLALLLAVPPAAFAQEVAPDALMKRISDDVLATLARDEALQAGDPAKLAALVEEKILPHFDFARATRIAVGAGWRHASEAEREALTREFRTLLVRTYSGALGGYRGQAIEFLPLRAGAGDAEVTVRSRIRQSGAAPIAIEYDMEKAPVGWKVFDVRIAGISLVATYRTAFADEIRNRGIPGLIALLSARNGAGTKMAGGRP